jgi:predicted RNA-binding protein with PUA-like domain
MVDLEAVTPVNKPVTLTNIRANRKLADMVLVKNSRLSVQPVTAAEWQEVCRMAGVSP